MRIHSCFSAALLAVALASCMAAQSQATAAQPEAAPAKSRGELKAERQFQMLDANGDGKLSRAEVALLPPLAAAFDEADTDHDGFVGMDEVRTFAVQYRARREQAKREAAAREPASAAAKP
ncbi:EF-hand domain-containing protein [Ramlibacter sp. H39-3-26]|uniref:EF-hand domain-containing protein n=1 Tax=Curvibacter soli TaxID=3031331 RepID=UPI0023D9B289|nr:EF-hand domain-containing protein [Ramlibacter sp. H39-3-26]MDF1485931.1 EF-hand domain-containing protein [Ramlibacter sp. H39-3-26]